jgi:cell division septal protein FtsQ
MPRLWRQGGLRPKARPTVARDLTPRLGRQQVNRPKDRQVRTELYRLAWHALRGVLALAMLLLVSAGLLLGSYVALAQGGTFAVQQAEIQGNVNLTALEILQAAGVGADSSLLTLPMRKVLEGLANVPLVEQATVQRVWPHTIRIQVVERRPYVQAVVEGQIHMLDNEMHPFAPVRSLQTVDLPVISGLSKADIVEPDEEILELMQNARRLLDSLPQGGLPATGRLSEVHLDRVWGLSAVFADLPATVRVGFGGFEAAWPRLEKICADLKQRGELERALMIDLDSDRRVVVRLGREAA